MAVHGLLLALLPVVLHVGSIDDDAGPTSSSAPGPAASAEAAPDDPFKNCGVGEAGIEILEGETDSPFPSPWCCGNTTWAAFKWRARASPNFLYTGATAAPPTGGGLSNATTCGGKRARESPDCFSFTFNNSIWSNFTTADQWSEWSEFNPSANTAWNRATKTTTKVATYFCQHAPNSGVDPIWHLELDLLVSGVAGGANVSLVTLEIQPHDASQPSYQIKMTAAHIESIYGGLVGTTQPLPLAFFLSRANLTNASSRPVITESEHFRPLLQALPQDSRAPKRIRINTGASSIVLSKTCNNVLPNDTIVYYL